MSREGVPAKARRLLSEGRVRILESSEDGGVVSASVRGDSGREYVVAYDVAGWSCSCPARGVCAHVAALQLLFVIEPREVAA